METYEFMMCANHLAQIAPLGCSTSDSSDSSPLTTSPLQSDRTGHQLATGDITKGHGTDTVQNYQGATGQDTAHSERETANRDQTRRNRDSSYREETSHRSSTSTHERAASLVGGESRRGRPKRGSSHRDKHHAMTPSTATTGSLSMRDENRPVGRPPRKRTHCGEAVVTKDVVDGADEADTADSSESSCGGGGGGTDRRNERERKRVRTVNSHFEELQLHVPHTRTRSGKVKRMSKVDVLRAAVDYIQYLQTVLSQDEDACAAQTAHAAPGDLANSHYRHPQFATHDNVRTYEPYPVPAGAYSDMPPLQPQYPAGYQSGGLCPEQQHVHPADHYENTALSMGPAAPYYTNPQQCGFDTHSMQYNSMNTWSPPSPVYSFPPVCAPSSPSDLLTSASSSSSTCTSPFFGILDERLAATGGNDADHYSRPQTDCVYQSTQAFSASAGVGESMTQWLNSEQLSSTSVALQGDAYVTPAHAQTLPRVSELLAAANRQRLERSGAADASTCEAALQNYAAPQQRHLVGSGEAVEASRTMQLAYDADT